MSKVVIIDGNGDGDWVITLADLEQLGKQLLADSPSAVEERVAAVGPDQLASLIYTSGTTGRPKGVRLTHGPGRTPPRPSTPSTCSARRPELPVAAAGPRLRQSDAGAAAVDRVHHRHRRARRKDRRQSRRAASHRHGAAPRIFEKAHARIEQMVAEQSRFKRTVFGWSMRVGLRVSAARQAGRKPSRAAALAYKLADRLVFSTIRERFGGRIRFFVSAAAALDRNVAQWFDAIGITVLEGYGLTETAAASFINRPHAYRFGTVGWPFPATEVKIAGDGEILLRGPGLMTSYHDLPDATTEALDQDGWFHTGDIGEVDADGYLRITDRKKDMFKTSQGKYVAPSAIEVRFKGLCPYVGELIVIGEAKPYCVALVSLDREAITDWAAKHGLAGRSFAEIAGDDRTRTLIAGYIDMLNSELNRWEQIKKFTILDRELSIESGDLTPSMKLRRKVVVDKSADQIAALYQD
ncbi:AMP-binding enzyme family protein [Mycobacterium kansasii]|uniref:Acyl-CoA synthetase n=1 Tax=Mycobacterium kansasii TaxID=1768 RepID=A0A1V3WI36_MYCKA|nr:AMP-binding enzyme family protein [Mycobacterium kansasii]